MSVLDLLLINPGSPLYNMAVEKKWELPEARSGFSQHSYDCTPLRTDKVTNRPIHIFNPVPSGGFSDCRRFFITKAPPTQFVYGLPCPKSIFWCWPVDWVRVWGACWRICPRSWRPSAAVPSLSTCSKGWLGTVRPGSS